MTGCFWPIPLEKSHLDYFPLAQMQADIRVLGDASFAMCL
jgi:hypothetical protein